LSHITAVAMKAVALLLALALRLPALPLSAPSSSAATTGSGSVRLAPVFADGFVLQDYYMFDSRSFIFGSAEPGESVKLTLTHDANTTISKRYEGVADAAGDWIVQIDPDYFNALPEGQVPNIGSKTLTLTACGSADGFAAVQTVRGVHYGDVFLCAGETETPSF